MNKTIGGLEPWTIPGLLEFLATAKDVISFLERFFLSRGGRGELGSRVADGDRVLGMDARRDFLKKKLHELRSTAVAEEGASKAWC